MCELRLITMCSGLLYHFDCGPAVAHCVAQDHGRVAYRSAFVRPPTCTARSHLNVCRCSTRSDWLLYYIFRFFPPAVLVVVLSIGLTRFAILPALYVIISVIMLNAGTLVCDAHRLCALTGV